MSKLIKISFVVLTAFGATSSLAEKTSAIDESSPRPQVTADRTSPSGAAPAGRPYHFLEDYSPN
jgi:hypothetical protein